MGGFANGKVTNVVAISGTIVVLSLNVLLILQIFGITIPGLPAAG